MTSTNLSYLQSNRPLRICLVNRTDICGGAEVVAQDQLREFTARGYEVKLLVGEKRCKDPRVIEIPKSDNNDFNYSAWHTALMDADVVHFHNLHGDYFDRGMIRDLSRDKVVVATLHDQYLFTGGCVHTRGCERWTSGCGSCPQVDQNSKVDRTADQWSQKKQLFSASRLHVIAPARWIYDRALKSLLAADEVTIHRIPNGVDTQIFHPNASHALRSIHGLPANQPLLLTVAQGILRNPSKDWDLLDTALRLLASSLCAPVTVIVLGDEHPDIVYSNVRIRFLGTVRDWREMAAWYSAADIYVHVSRAETFCLAILEAMASGCAVLSTAVGGVQEQLEPESEGDATCGIVVETVNPRNLSEALLRLINNPQHWVTLSAAAIERVNRKWALTHHVDTHLALYQMHSPS